MWVRGWASLPAFAIAVFGGPLLGSVLVSVLGGGVVTFVGGFLLAVPLTEWFGLWFNSERVEGGSWRDRCLHDTHTVNDMPVQGLMVVPAVLGLFAALWAASTLRHERGAVVYLIPMAAVVLPAAYVLGTRWASVRETVHHVRWTRRNRAMRDPDVRRTVRLSPAEAAEGMTRTVRYRVRKVCPVCAGDGRRTDKPLTKCPACRGRGRYGNGSYCNRCKGAGTVTRGCRRCAGTGLGPYARARVTIRTPAGIRRQSVVRIAGKGTPGTAGSRRGDVLLRVAVPGRRPATATPPSTSPADAPVPPPRSTRTPRQPTSSSPTTPSRGPATPPHHKEAPGPRTIGTDEVRFHLDAAGFSVTTRRVSVTGTRWTTEVEMPWADVRTVEFATGPHDSVRGLYTIPVTGTRRFVVDHKQLRRAQWREIATLIGKYTDGRITLRMPDS